MQLRLESKRISVAADEVESFDLPRCWWFRIEPEEQPVPAQFRLKRQNNESIVRSGRQEFPPVAFADAQYKEDGMEFLGGADGAVFTVLWATTTR